MRPPSPSLMSSLHALHFRTESDSRDEWIRAITEIASQSHPAIALSLAPLALVPDPEVANAAVQALLRVLSRLDEQGILWITREGRNFGISGGSWQFAWCEMRQPDVPRLESFGEASIGLLCIGSVHASGYVRQACVERLTNFRGALPMAFLLVRINDWVRSVRASARLAVFGRLLEARRGDIARGEELLENLLLADHIGQWNRDDHGPIRDAIQATLTSPSFQSVREQGLRDKRSWLRSRMYKLTLEQSVAPFEVLRDALMNRNGTVRIWAAREATKRLAADELRLLVEIMQKDSLAIVRHEAVFVLATKLSPLVSSTLTPFLHDSSSNVRFLAAHYLEKNRYDVRAHYLEALSCARDTELAAIVTGIGEKGKPGDELVVKPFVGHHDPLVRRAAVFTMGKLQQGGDAPWLFDALRDTHKLVAREAARQIDARIHIVDTHVIESWFQSASRLSTRRQSVRIGAKLERWEALGFLLRAALVDHQTVRQEVERELLRWFHLFIDWYAPPNREQFAQLERAFAAVRDTLDESLSHCIEHTLATQKTKLASPKLA